ncbi:hypothetical protein [Paenibacillus taichungensis]|uniref:hypothetical protein n=1 Tax=Paenibacillus taichungensis TaxID=484184 RepID=UPI00117DFD3F|nr:hypothetical protein [Paenibacillus taichungensis]
MLACGAGPGARCAAVRGLRRAPAARPLRGAACPRPGAARRPALARAPLLPRLTPARSPVFARAPALPRASPAFAPVRARAPALPRRLTPVRPLALPFGSARSLRSIPASSPALGFKPLFPHS